MVSKYHSVVERGIILAGKELIERKKVRKIERGNKRPIPITALPSKKIVSYKPDVYFILRNNKKVIFEVLESESKKQDVIIADVTRSCLAENVEAIIFVFQGDEKIYDRIWEALITIIKGLVYKGIPEKELPSYSSGVVPSGTIVVTRKEVRDIEAIKRKILIRFEK